MKIGWSSIDTTPRGPVKLQGQFHERISQSVRDPLTATVLALEADSPGGKPEQLVMVSCDICMIARSLQEKVRKALRAGAPDLDPSRLFMNATHIHTGPAIDPEWEKMLYPIVDGALPFELPKTTYPPDLVTASAYADFLADRLTEAIVRAWKNRRPGGVSWALSHATVGHNRRVVYDDDSALMYGNTDRDSFLSLEAPSDSGVELLYTWDTEKKLTGIVIDVACPSQVVEQKYYVSADYWSEVRKEVHRRYGAGLPVATLCGAAGDQSPRDQVRRGRGEPCMSEEEGMVEIGDRIANAVTRKFEYARANIRTDTVLRHTVKELRLPLRKVTDAEAAQARKEYDAILAKWKSENRPVDSSLFFQLFAPSGILRRVSLQKTNHNCAFEVHVARIGDVALATNPFELFIDYGLRMKARSKAQQTFLVQLACDCGGYLPTERAVKGGHYSAVVSSGFIGPEGGRLLADQTVEMINALWE
jgi:hypothetical protein